MWSLYYLNEGCASSNSSRLIGPQKRAPQGCAVLETVNTARSARCAARRWTRSTRHSSFHHTVEAWKEAPVVSGTSARSPRSTLLARAGFIYERFPTLDPSLSALSALRPHSPSFGTMSKANLVQVFSCSNFSHRARFGVLLGGILFLSAIFLYQVHPPHLEDFGYTLHSSPPQHGELLPSSSNLPPEYGMLESRLAYQEKLYQIYLEERKGLITKWGPTPDKVKT